MKVSVFDGGDMRFIYLKKLLQDDGFEIDDKAENIILPLPLNESAFRQFDFFSKLCNRDLNGTKIFGGCVCEAIRDHFEKLGADVYDYMQSESVLRFNASLTVEAALCIGTEKSDCGYIGSHCLITGFGRIGMRLCSALRSLGANVTVAVRNFDKFPIIESTGAIACDINKLPSLNEFDFIFNTVPSVVITETIPSECTAIELASKDGFANMQNVILARGLPGKYSPLSAAKAIHISVLDYLKGED